MWCPTCRADVAAELTLDNRRYRCVQCHAEMGAAEATIDHLATPVRAIATERSARELLARWSAQNRFEPVTLASSLPPAAVNFVVSAESGEENGRVEKGAIWRLDTPRQSAPTASAGPVFNEAFSNPSSPPAKLPEEIPCLGTGNQRPCGFSNMPHDEASDNTSHPDHRTKPCIAKQANSQIHWIGMAGQLCAYCGVGLLTCGSVVVLLEYFGGQGNYAPTGWLVAAVGQMLLFLGLVTLVSAGIEQAVDEVAWRIADLEHRLEEHFSSQRVLPRQPDQSSVQDRSEAA